MIDAGMVARPGKNAGVLVALASDDDGVRLRRLTEAGTPDGPVEAVHDLPATVARLERELGPRWLWTATAALYPRLLAAGVRVGRCHDLELTEALLLGHDGRWGEPRALAAIWARAAGLPVPPDPPPPEAPTAGQGLLFDLPHTPSPAAGFDQLEALIEAYAQQRQRIDALPEAARFRLLVAAESAGALVAAEMGHDGLPWRADAHDAVLQELLGEGPPPMGG